MLHPNNQRLVEDLETLPILEDRYVDLKLVNNPGGVKRGNFSLVFKAFDKIDNAHVAIKFYDLDPSKQLPFRLACFDREHELLTGLIGVGRCLQVSSPISRYHFNIGSPSSPFQIAAKYFVTEWCEYDVDEFFLNQDSNQALFKLKLFNEVVLAIAALHSRDVFHRDIKVDNFRRRTNDTDGVIAIDLGTAAATNSSPMLAAYDSPVGMLPYSAPETFCGLAGSRELAHLTDVYALGCILFELFSEDDFWTAYNDLNPDYGGRLTALISAMPLKSTDPNAVALAWDRHAPHLFAGLTRLEFSRDGMSVPLAIVDIVNDLLAKMTTPNFRFRTTSLEMVRRRIWSAIKCLENQVYARKRAERIASEREARREKAKRRGASAVGNILDGASNGTV